MIENLQTYLTGKILITLALIITLIIGIKYALAFTTKTPGIKETWYEIKAGEKDGENEE